MSFRERILDSFVMQWVFDYAGQLFVIAVVFAAAVALDIFKRRCEAWGLSEWLIAGTEDTAKFMFRCDQFLISAIVVFGTAVALFDYVKKGISKL